MYMFGGFEETRIQAEQYTKDIFTTEQVITDLSDHGKIADFPVTDQVFADYDVVFRTLCNTEWQELPLSGRRFLLHRLVLKAKRLSELNDGPEVTLPSSVFG